MLHQLQAIELEKEYVQGGKTQKVLARVSASFKSRESYAIIGASGCGKSTFLHLLSGLDIPTKGTVHFDDTDIFSLSTQQKNTLLSESFGFVFQFHYLIKELSVLENVMVPGLIKGQSDSVCKQHAQELLSHLGLQEKMYRVPTELSGGEQQRVSVARALFNKPKFLFADEPTGNLDEANAKKLIDLLLSYKNEWGMGLIVCSHDSRVFEKMDHITRLHNGVLEHVK